MSKPLSATDIRAALAPWLRMSRAFQQLDDDAAALQVEERRLAAAKQQADAAQVQAATHLKEWDRLVAEQTQMRHTLADLTEQITTAKKALDETRLFADDAKILLERELAAARAAHAKGLADDLKAQQAALQALRDEQAAVQRELDAARIRVRDFQAGLTSLAR